MKKKISNVSAVIFRVIVGLIYVSPIILMLLFSLQSNSEIGTIPLKVITQNPTLENYKYVIENIPIMTYLKNTFIMILICVPCQLMLASLGAYAFSFFEFPAKNLLFTIYLASMMIPGDVIIMSNYMTIQNLELINTYLGMTITSLVGVTGIFMLTQYMKSLPKELWEAAKIDGCGEMRYFFKVVFPLSKPVLASMGINSTIAVYNAYFWPLLVTTQDEMRTIQLGMAKLMSADVMRYGDVLAGAVLSLLIPTIIFMVGQDYIVKGMTAGAVKS